MMEKKHIHETNPKRTIVTAIIFVVIIVVGLLTVRSPLFIKCITSQQYPNVGKPQLLEY